MLCWRWSQKLRSKKLLLLQFPREVMERQAVDKGDFQFFELAYVNVEFEKPKKLMARIKLKDFIIPNTLSGYGLARIAHPPIFPPQSAEQDKSTVAA